MMSEAGRAPARIAILSGGVGGAKFAAGLHAVLDPGQLVAIVNTADDFDHLGLRICPDLDSVLYALANIQDETRGWGRRQESWNCLETLRELGAEDWFALGDRDLAVHLLRSQSLRDGASLADVTARISSAYRIESIVVPMTESRVSTVVATEDGELPMQDYFVRRRCKPTVHALRYEGAQNALFHPKAQALLSTPDLRGVFIAPSNPFLSIDPILAMPGVRKMLKSLGVPIVAISPLIGGKSLKGPLSDMLISLGLGSTTRSIATHYGDLIDGLVIDSSDAQDAQSLDIPVLATPTLMSDHHAREALARASLDFLDRLKNG